MRYFLDTNIFLYALENPGKLGTKARELLKTIELNNIEVVTSVITLFEVLTGVYKRGLSEKVPLYLEFLTNKGKSKMISIDKNIAVRGAQVRSKHLLKTPDALQIAAAIKSKSYFFVTADRRFPKKVEGLRIKLL